MSKTYTGRILLTHSTLKINPVVGDFFKSQKGEMAKWAKKASNLITWLRSKTIILSHLGQLRIEAGLTALAVIRAVLTRWMAHYMAYRRLLELQPQLNLLIVRMQQNILQTRLLSLEMLKQRLRRKGWLNSFRRSHFSGIILHGTII